MTACPPPVSFLSSLMELTPEQYQEIKTLLDDRKWRLNNLYPGPLGLH